MVKVFCTYNLGTTGKVIDLITWVWLPLSECSASSQNCSYGPEERHFALYL